MMPQPNPSHRDRRELQPSSSSSLPDALTRGERPKPSPRPARRATDTHPLTQRASGAANRRGKTDPQLYSVATEKREPPTHAHPHLPRCRAVGLASGNSRCARTTSACHAVLRSVRWSRYSTHHTQSYVEPIRCSRLASLTHTALSPPAASGSGHKRCGRPHDPSNRVFRLLVSNGTCPPGPRSLLTDERRVRITSRKMQRQFGCVCDAAAAHSSLK